MSIIVFFVGGDFDSALGVFIPSGATADSSMDINVVVNNSDIARGVSRCSRKIKKRKKKKKSVRRIPVRS